MTGDHEVHVERLLGRQVLARNGRRIGRLEELRAEKRGHEHVVIECLIGSWGWLERLSLAPVWRLGGLRGYRARWDQIDVSDARRPRLRCSVEELERIER